MNFMFDSDLWLPHPSEPDIHVYHKVPITHSNWVLHFTYTVCLKTSVVLTKSNILTPNLPSAFSQTVSAGSEVPIGFSKPWALYYVHRRFVRLSWDKTVFVIHLASTWTMIVSPHVLFLRVKNVPTNKWFFGVLGDLVQAWLHAGKGESKHWELYILLQQQRSVLLSRVTLVFKQTRHISVDNISAPACCF